MCLLYLDEAGDTGRWDGDQSAAQPAIAVVALMVEWQSLGELTSKFIRLKRRFFPRRFVGVSHLDSILCEIKGSDIRSKIRNRGDAAKAELHFMDAVFNLMRTHDVRLQASFWPKKIHQPIDGDALYSTSVHNACVRFESFLAENNHLGIVIADSRNDKLNSITSHAVFTRKHDPEGDAYPHIVESVVFGHSQSHAMLQLADFMATTVIWPVLTQALMAEAPSSLIRSRDRFIWIRYAKALRAVVGFDGSLPKGLSIEGLPDSSHLLFPVDFKK